MDKLMRWQRHGSSKFLELYVNTERGFTHYSSLPVALKRPDYNSMVGIQHSKGMATYHHLFKLGYTVVAHPDRAATLVREDAEFAAEQQKESV